MSKPKPFNNPFGGLKLKNEEPEKPSAKARAPAPPSRSKADTAPTSAEDESRLFFESVGSVEPVCRGVARADEPSTPPGPQGPSDDDEVLAQLSELVAGDAPFDLSSSDELIQGSIANLDPAILDRLGRGDYAVQAHVDLHGLTRAEAKAALETFVVESRHKHLRCVLVVHGRGLHSEDQIPVLKESVQLWLSRGRSGRQVLAFATARPHDGGAGAVYVLLRR